MDFEKILRVAVRGGASDIILKTHSVPRFRYNGSLVSLSEGEIISPQIMIGWMNDVLPEYLKDALKTRGDADFAYQSKDGYRFRVNLFRQRQEIGMVLRVISNHVRTLEELQLPNILHNLALEKRGLILVTGATGSGKSTTLAAMLQKINRERSAHVVTIEDPIEFNFKDDCSTFNQREIGLDTADFPTALRASLRQNPDVILVGELRDGETTATALQAAETGHLVLSTLHTTDAVDSLTRILSFFPPHQHTSIRQMISHSLRAVISQRLVLKRDRSGMAVAIEIMVNNANVRDVIREGENFQNLHQVIRNSNDTYGMQTFDQSLLQLYKSGVISREEAMSQASSKEDFNLHIRGVSA